MRTASSMRLSQRARVFCKGFCIVDIVRSRVVGQGTSLIIATSQMEWNPSEIFLDPVLLGVVALC